MLFSEEVVNYYLKHCASRIEGQCRGDTGNRYAITRLPEQSRNDSDMIKYISKRDIDVLKHVTRAHSHTLTQTQDKHYDK